RYNIDCFADSMLPKTGHHQKDRNILFLTIDRCCQGSIRNACLFGSLIRRFSILATLVTG
ncbi:MAG: hypothetical protein NUK65_08150, partial [Firmicutes bacterium]|nr:hypothetical protein [Bacillota bacterium]